MEKNKIYLNVPANSVAGGVESLYQLCDAINNCGGDCIILFDNFNGNPVPEKYNHYNIKYSPDVDDSKNNWIIYPEVWTEKINEFKNLKKGIWWLSVDNNHSKFNDFSNHSIMHFYQSNYALQHLISKGAYNYLPIFDYISKKYLEKTFDIKEKQNIICFNPIKGRGVTQKIMDLNPDLNFVPLVMMSEDDVLSTLKKSKIYIDFGHHPGRDRIPREAAHLGNCIITNNSGSAKYFNDIPIQKQYKIDDINDSSAVIRQCLDFYEEKTEDFSLYRSFIKNQKEQMFNQVKQIL